jgi:hypothetical protein
MNKLVELVLTLADNELLYILALVWLSLLAYGIGLCIGIVWALTI